MSKQARKVRVLMTGVSERWARYWRRIHSVWESRGVIGLLRFLVSRIVYRKWTSKLYRDDPAAERSMREWPEGYRFELCGPLREVPVQVVNALLEAGAGEALGAFDWWDRIWVVWHGSQVAAYGGVFERSPQQCILGLPDNAVLLGWGFVVPEYRRRGLHRLALGEVARQLRSEGKGEIYVEVHPENTASVRGIEAAGFRETGLVEAAIWFGRLVRRDGRWHQLKR